MKRWPWVLLFLAGCATREAAIVGGSVQTVSAMGDISTNGPATTSGRMINPLTGRPFDQAPDPRAKAEAVAVDEATRLVEDGLFDRARVKIDALIAAGATHPSVPFLKARLTVQAGDLEAAIPWCEKSVAASPSWVEPRLLLARIYLKLERPAAAGSVYEDIDRLAPWSAWGPYGVGWVAWMRGDKERAAARFDEALKRDPDHLPTLRARAAVAQAAGDTAAEARCLDRALVLMPEDPSLHLRLADLAQAQQRQEDTRRHLERAWALDPRPAIAHRLADLARSRGETEDAARWSARAGGPSAPEGAALTNDEIR